MSRGAALEWATVAVLLLGCAAVTAGVIAIALEPGIAALLIIIGAAVAVVGAIAWTVVVKGNARRARRAG